MTEYELIFILDGIHLDDHHAVTDLQAQFDAEVTQWFGVPRMIVNAKGGDACTAAVTLVADVRRTVGTVRFVNVDRDLVDAESIAGRTGVTTQDVETWTEGKVPHATPFPTPEARTGASPVWLWCEVNAWLAQLGLDDGRKRPSRYEMNEIDTLMPYLPVTGLTALHHRPRVTLLNLIAGTSNTPT